MLSGLEAVTAKQDDNDTRMEQIDELTNAYQERLEAVLGTWEERIEKVLGTVEQQAGIATGDAYGSSSQHPAGWARNSEPEPQHLAGWARISEPELTVGFEARVEWSEWIITHHVSKGKHVLVQNVPSLGWQDLVEQGRFPDSAGSNPTDRLWWHLYNFIENCKCVTHAERAEEDRNADATASPTTHHYAYWQLMKSCGVNSTKSKDKGWVKLCNDFSRAVSRLQREEFSYEGKMWAIRSKGNTEEPTMTPYQATVRIFKPATNTTEDFFFHVPDFRSPSFMDYRDYLGTFRRLLTHLDILHEP